MLTPEQAIRFEELKKKGGSRNAEERVEFQELSEVAQVQAAATIQGKETVEVEKTQLSALLAEMDRMKAEISGLQKKTAVDAGSDGWEEISLATGPKKARIRLFKLEDVDYVVVDYKFISEDRTTGNVLLEYELTLRDKKGKIKFHRCWFDDFVLQENYIIVDIKNLDVVSKIKKFGEVRQKQVEGYKTVETDTVVPLTVVMEDGEATVSHLEFGEFTLPINRLNS
jgi:hypothetical protein